ncbi:MAG: hypothetical protein IJ816_04950 [Alloprevotella sp.]|nr:hypothetical protein [Alloprevotella sp.]
MKEFPKWVLTQAFFNIIPVFLSVFFLFGGLHPFGTSTNIVLSFLLYVLTNLLWLFPALTFFFGLDIYRRGWYWQGIAILALGNVLTICDILLIILR